MYLSVSRIFTHVEIEKLMPAAVLRHKVMLPSQAQHRHLAPAGRPPPQLRSVEAPAVQGPWCLGDPTEGTKYAGQLHLWLKKLNFNWLAIYSAFVLFSIWE